jgi:Polyketide cyclase / dehydrase and lipid transport
MAFTLSPWSRELRYLGTVETPTLTHAESIVIARTPEDLYDMVSDVTRMGEWSPVCKKCWWDDGDGPRVGAWFTGHNEAPDRDPWDTRSQVVAASRGEEFAFTVGGSWVRWGYTFTPVAEGARVTESWEVLPDGVRRFEERFGADAGRQLANRFEAARTGIPVTLAALKRAAESA